MRALALLTAAVLLSLLAGCGGGTTTAQPSDQAGPAGLPSLASLPHGSSIVSNDTANGSAYLDAAHQVNSGTAVYLESAGLLPPEMAYSIYQIAQRPGDKPTTITVNALFYDQTPIKQDQTEGYWVAYGDFTGGAGVWRLKGPFNQYQARVSVPASTVVANGSGNIFVAVVLEDGNRVKLGNVQLGYSAGVGYESYRLAAPRGAAVGRMPQVEVDADGQVQVAYLQSQMNYGGLPFTIKVAKLLPGGEWEVQAVSLPYKITNVFAFACGSSGRRALLVMNEDTEDLHLLWDGGSGTFTDATILWPSYDADTLPALAFINSADTPGGERDTALAVYGGTSVYPNIDVNYYRYDGVNPPATGLVVNVRQPGKLNLMPDSGMTALATPTAPAYPVMDAAFFAYSAAANVWLPGPAPTLTDIPLENDDEPYSVALQPMGGGHYTAGYINEDEGNINFSFWDGVAWSTPLEQQVSCVRPRPWLDFATFSDGTVVFPTHYNGFNLAVYEGVPGTGLPFSFHPAPGTDNNALETSIAVDASDVAHIVASNPASGRLDYYTFLEDGTLSAPQPVDEGSDGFGINYGPCGVVYTANALHIFAVDSAHFRLLHSENRNGIWVRESEPIDEISRFAYVLLNAGYLETTGQLWVAFIDGVDMGIYVAYTDPPSGNTWNWHAYRINSVIEEPMAAVADDETNIACTSLMYSPIAGAFMSFVIGKPGATPANYEPVTADYNLAVPPQVLSYNKVDHTWNLIAQDDNSVRSYLWHRQAPGLWQGPYLIAAHSDLSDSVVAAGITYNSTSGLARIVVYEKTDATNRFKLSIVGQTNSSSFNFSPPITFMDEDNAVTGFGGFSCVPDADGNPIVAVLAKPVAAPAYDVTFYNYDGLGNWIAGDTWASPIQSLSMDRLMSFPLATSPIHQLAFAATEMDTSSANFGRVFVYYPW
jgi:hypothetical protein